MSVTCDNIFTLEADALVSPANSFGRMDGGLDAQIVEFLGEDIESEVQQLIRDRHDGELVVGQAEVVITQATQFPFLVVAPTMRVPQNVSRTVNAYLAFRAALRAVRAFNEEHGDIIQTLLVPGLGTDNGFMPPLRSRPPDARRLRPGDARRGPQHGHFFGRRRGQRRQEQAAGERGQAAGGWLMNRASSWPLLLGAATFLAVALAFGNILRKAQTSENVGFTATPLAATDKPALNLEFVKAAARGNIPRLKALLAQGADTDYVFRGSYDNFPDNNYDSATDGIIDGRSALSAASEQGHLNAVKFLVAHGAEVNRHDDDYYAHDWTPIMHAVWGDERLGDPNRIPILKYLIEAGADVNATAQAVPHDETVLTIAAEGGFPEAVNLLIAAGAKPNAVTGDGNTCSG